MMRGLRRVKVVKITLKVAEEDEKNS